MKTTEYAAVTAAHSVDPDRWQTEFSAVIDRIAPRFRRYEPLRHAGELMAGMVSGLDRKNCWTIAEHRGDTTPDGLQHLLARASWDAEEVRDDLREYVIDAFGDPGAILVVDETGDVKKGSHSVGVQRQYSGTAGRIENSQVAVYLTYAAPRGHALIDRALYLPRAGPRTPTAAPTPESPPTKGFATKPTLAARTDRPRRGRQGSRGVGGRRRSLWRRPPAAAAVRDHGLGYVLAVAANRRVPTHAGPIRVDALPALIPAHAWQKHSAGAGAHGPRLYSWAWFRLLAEDDTDTGVHHLLIRRNDTTGELAYLAATARAGAAAHPGRRGRSALAYRGILPSRQRAGRARSAPGPALDDPGTAGPPWPCSPTPSWPWPPPPNAIPHPPRQD